jgi:hypothetical protein
MNQVPIEHEENPVQLTTVAAVAMWMMFLAPFVALAVVFAAIYLICK